MRRFFTDSWVSYVAAPDPVRQHCSSFQAKHGLSGGFYWLSQTPPEFDGNEICVPQTNVDPCTIVDHSLPLQNDCTHAEPDG
jgi:hypothetical protein